MIAQTPDLMKPTDMFQRRDRPDLSAAAAIQMLNVVKFLSMLFMKRL